jgi:hypothetical protein
VQHAVLDPVRMHTNGYRHDPTDDRATGYVLAPRPARAVPRAALPEGIVADRHGDHVARHPFTVAGGGAGYGGLIGNGPLGPHPALVRSAVVTLFGPANPRAGPPHVTHCACLSGPWN